MESSSYRTHSSNDNSRGTTTIEEEARTYVDAISRIDALEDELSRRADTIRELRHRVRTLVERERTWERTTSELSRRNELLRGREGAWERTIGELLNDVAVVRWRGEFRGNDGR